MKDEDEAILAALLASPSPAAESACPVQAHLDAARETPT